MTLRMLDSIFPQNLPAGADAYLGYVGGNWVTFPELQRLFPAARLLSMAVFASEDADGLDVETGDATIADIYGWFRRQQARGVWRPVVYSSAGNIGHIVATMTANGFPRDSYRLLSAHYTGTPHICGPGSCGATSGDCDGTQWTDHAPGAGGSLVDESLLSDTFFGSAPNPSPPVTEFCPDQGDTHMILFPQGRPTPIRLTGTESRIGFSPVFGAAGSFPAAEVSVNFHGQPPVTVHVDPGKTAGDMTLDIPGGVEMITVFRMDPGPHDVSCAVW